LNFGLSQSQTNYWIHRLLPVLRQALQELGHTPEREAVKVKAAALVHEGGAALLLDGTERRRQRPADKAQQKAHYSGKKKGHTDKNLLLTNENSGKVAYLSPTVAGKTHDKKMADEADIAYPCAATLAKDTGFQGYQPPGVFTLQPQKRNEDKRTSGECDDQIAQWRNLQLSCARRTHDSWCQTRSYCQRNLATSSSGDF